MNLKINLIVATSENLGIGKQGRIPWALKKEMAFFTNKTKGVSCYGKQNAVLMGRKTWESIPEKFRPLKDRANIVLSSSSNKNYPDEVICCCSFEEALINLQKPPLSENIETVWVIGGYSVYKLAMESDFCHRIYITRIKQVYDCDTFFPKIPLSFVKVKVTDVPSDEQEENGIPYEYEVYEKVTKTVL